MPTFHVTASIEFSYVNEFDDSEELTNEDVAESEYDAFLPDDAELKVVQYQITQSPTCANCGEEATDSSAKFCTVCGGKFSETKTLLIEGV